MPSLLIVESRDELREKIADVSEEEGFETRAATTVPEARAEIASDPPDALLLDVDLEGRSGLEILLAARHPDLRAVILLDETEAGDRFDADDLALLTRVPRPASGEELRKLLRETCRGIRGARARAGEESIPAFESMVGVSDALETLRRQIEIVAPTDATVLVTGESGVGKELVARAIHNRSRRADGPFVPLNCGAIPDELVDSELFGHEKGAFTGAHRSRAGVVEKAKGGTLLLDEIGEMPPDLQVRLLRVLEERTFRRVGGDREIEVDFRVLAATNREAREAVEEGSLREDLYYRLAEFPIHVPALRRRPEDVEPIARHHLENLNERGGTRKVISAEALERLRAFHWPGNVRQLLNAVRRAWLLAGDEIREEHLPRRLRDGPGESSAGPLIEVRVGAPIDDAERRLILATLEHCGGNRRETARALGISLRTLYNRLKEYREGETAAD